MNRQSTNLRAWVMHLVLTLAVCMWLSIARATDVSFITTIMVTAAITLSGGFVTKVRANGVFRGCQKQVADARSVARLKAAELRRFVLVLPILHMAFAQLHPDRAYDPATSSASTRPADKRYDMYHFASWLRWALQQPGVNIVDWMMRRAEPDGSWPQLKGIFGHLEGPAYAAAMEYVNVQADGMLCELSMFYETDPLNNTAVPRQQSAATKPPRTQTRSPGWARSETPRGARQKTAV